MNSFSQMLKYLDIQRSSQLTPPTSWKTLAHIVTIVQIASNSTAVYEAGRSGWNEHCTVKSIV
jgi:hypothetical protein